MARVFAKSSWVNPRVKSLILRRQKAANAYGADSAQFKQYRNLVKGEKKPCKGCYYQSKIQHLRGENLKRRWEEDKRLSGAKTKEGDLCSQINDEQFTGTS